MSNGNYRTSNDEENSNASAAKCQSEPELLKANKEDEEIDLLADEKFSDNENFESSIASNSDKQTNAKDRQHDELVKQVNRMSNYLTVELVNKIIDEIDQTHKSFSLDNILKKCAVAELVGLSEAELAAFLVKCIKNGLLKKEDPMYGEMLMYSIKKSQVLDKLRVDEITYRKVISALKVLMKEASLSPELMLIGLKDQFKLLQSHNLVSFNDLLRNRLLKEGFLLELPNDHFKLLCEINDETSNTSVQSASNNYSKICKFWLSLCSYFIPYSNRLVLPQSLEMIIPTSICSHPATI